MPTNLRIVSLEEIQAHEVATGANARLGGYDMDKHCPLGEIACIHAALSECDLNRLFLLPDFKKYTVNYSCQLVDVNDSAIAVAMERQPSELHNELDLSARIGLELILVGTDVEDRPLIVVDGNHRLLAHYIRNRSIDGIPVYLGIHRNVHKWRFVPEKAC